MVQFKYDGIRQLGYDGGSKHLWRHHVARGDCRSRASRHLALETSFKIAGRDRPI